jgi:hypothetical protein
VRLTAGGETKEAPLVVQMDPRVKVAPKALAQQRALSLQLTDALLRDRDALLALKALRAKNPAAPLLAKLAALEGAADDHEAPPPPQAKEAPQTLTRLNAQLTSVYERIQSADAAPPPQLAQAAERLLRETEALVQQWQKLGAEASTAAR